MTPERAHARRWWTLAGFCLVLFASVSFKSMVGIAIPELQADLKASLGQIQWLLNAYTLMLAALLLTVGALADRLGRRRVYVAGLVTFAAGALACLLSPSVTVLDFSSGLMGVGGAVIFSAGAALLSTRFTGPDRAVAFASFGTTVGAAAAAGPLLAGVLIDALGWRGVFGFLTVLALAGVTVEVLRGAPAQESPARAKRLDWVGPVTFTGAIFLLVFALIRGNDEGFGSLVIVGSLSSAVALLAAFAASQLAYSGGRGHREPMLHLDVLRRPSVTGAAAASFVLGFVVFGVSFYAAVYLGPVLANSATATGLKLLPMTAVAFAAAPLGGWLMRRLPMRALLPACLLLMAGGSLLLRGVDEGSSWTALLAGFVLIGLGSGAIVAPLLATAVGVVAEARAGVAAAINNTARQLGIAFGVAGLGAYFQARVAARLDGVENVDPDAAAQLVVGGAFEQAAQAAPAGARDDVATAGLTAFFAGLDEVFVIVAVVAVMGALAAAALIRRRDFVIPPAGRVGSATPVNELATVP